MNEDNNYRLALDINTSAIGLATYILDAENQPIELAHVDVSVFGEPLADEKTGKVKKTLRRKKRLMRRQTQRRAQRLKKIAHLFPLAGVNSDAVRKEQKHQRDGGVHAWRAKAATEKIALTRLMAVFLLMAKNRGYEGRFTKGEDGKVKKNINEVESLMEKHQCDTLGQLLYTLKKDSTNHNSVRAWKKISETGTYTHREMLKKEFCTIWKTQEEHHPSLKRKTQNDERIADVYEHYLAVDADKKSDVKSILPRPEDGDVSLYNLFRMVLFDQRPIWWDKETIGKCELETDQLRAPKAHPLFQTYRIEQTLNDLELKRSKRKLTNEEKEKLRPLFDEQKTVSASKLYKGLGIEKDRFTHDRSKQHGIASHTFLGNKTKCEIDKLEKDADMSLSEREREVFIQGEHGCGKDTLSLSEREREVFIQLIADVDEPSVFGHEQWDEQDNVRSYFEASTDEEKQKVVNFINKLYEKDKIQTVAKMELDTGRADYSIKAIRKLLPLMKKGKRPDEAVKLEYPDRKEKKHDISRVGDSVVQQSLRETMQAIDYAIRKHGGQLPKQVVVELSRDMKLSQKKRKEIEKAQEAKKEVKDKARKEIEKAGSAPNETMCKRYILWIEQGKECAYCGQCIELVDVCRGETEIDHIIPKAYGGQNFHANLAVVHKVCNQEKAERLPLEAFGGTEKEKAIRSMREKMKKTNYLTKPFDAYKNDVKRRAEILLIKDRDDCEGDFKLRQNSETAWIGRELTAYLKQRCNINITDKERLEDRVYVTRGTLTRYMRRHLGLDTLIADIRKDEGKPVFNRKGKIMPDGGDSACGSWHKEHEDFDERYDKRSDHRHHAIDAAVVGLVDRGTFMKATKHYEKNGSLKGFEFEVKKYPAAEKEKLRKTLHNRLYNYVVWHKPDRRPIAGFFDETIRKREKKKVRFNELTQDCKKKDDVMCALRTIIDDAKRIEVLEYFEERYTILSGENAQTPKRERRKEIDIINDALFGEADNTCITRNVVIEVYTNKLIIRRSLEDIVKDAKTKEDVLAACETIVGKTIKAHIITEFERRYKEFSDISTETARIKGALCGKNANDGIFFSLYTKKTQQKHKIKHVKCYQKEGGGFRSYRDTIDKTITTNNKNAKNGEKNSMHVHSLSNRGFACVEVRENKKFTCIPYWKFWTKAYQARLKNDDKVMRIYKNDTLYDKESKDFYIVQKFTGGKYAEINCIKTTEALPYKDLEKTKLTKDFGKTKIPYIRLVKSRNEIAAIKSDIRNTHESPSDHSD